MSGTLASAGRPSICAMPRTARDRHETGFDWEQRSSCETGAAPAVSALPSKTAYSPANRATSICRPDKVSGLLGLSFTMSYHPPAVALLFFPAAARFGSMSMPGMRADLTSVRRTPRHGRVSNPRLCPAFAWTTNGLTDTPRRANCRVPTSPDRKPPARSPGPSPRRFRRAICEFSAPSARVSRRRRGRRARHRCDVCRAGVGACSRRPKIRPLELAAAGSA